MRSKYDQPDAPPTEQEPEEEVTDMRCFWCDRALIEVDCQPYCSPLCAVHAAVDSEDC